MEIFNLNNLNKFVCSFLIFSIVVTPCYAIEECSCFYCEVCEEFEDFDEVLEIDYESLEDFEDTFREFETELDLLPEDVDLEYEVYYEEGSDDPICKAEFFAKKWCKKVKNWMRKSVYKMSKKVIDFKKYRDPETCAYEVAKFKRGIDRWIFKTPAIDVLIRKFEKKTADFPEMHKLSERIKFYSKNKHARPPKVIQGPSMSFDKHMTRPETNDDFANVPDRAIFGGVLVFSGLLICAIPYCAPVGAPIALWGAEQIYEGYVQERERNQYRQDYSVG